MFDPSATLRVVSIAPGQPCLVIDDALLDPQRLVDLACAHRDAFALSPHNAFPGPELTFPPPVIARFEAMFNARARALLGGRRTLSSTARLSLVTRAPDALSPAQCFCHTDGGTLEPGHGIAACVLYLFHDPSLGGTAFYAPARAPEEIAALRQAARTLPPQEFSARFGIARGYMTEGNAWFRKLASVPARFNRLIFYSGLVPHSGEIVHPERLDPDPAHGRLTVNGFFRYTLREGALREGALRQDTPRNGARRQGA